VRPGRLVVDLEHCPFVDACALTMLLDVHRRAWRAGGVLTLRGCSPRVLRLLSLTGLRRVFDLAEV
jgi:anti-anti-sigma factor